MLGRILTRLKITDRRAMIAILALVYTALFMPSVIAIQPSTATMLPMFLGGFAYSWALFFTLRSLRKLFLIFTPTLFLASAVASYYMYHFQFEVSFQQLAVITEVQTQTALAFVTLPLVLWALASTCIGFFLARWCSKSEHRDPRNARITFITSILLLCIFTQETGSITQRYFPFNLLLAVKHFAAEKIILARQESAPPATLTYTKTKDPITVILIVGESVRAKNWGLNGYARQTTPLLAQRKGLVNFTDVTSCFPLTRVAVPCILTNQSYNHTVTEEFSLLKLFRDMGFFTASIDMHGMSDSIFGSPVSKLLHDGNQLISFNGGMLSDNNIDDAGVASLRKVIGQQHKDLFVVFHPFGSHWPYDTRYPERFRKYKPVCNPLHNSIVALAQDMSECVPQELVNAYDNSILYADTIVDAVMESVKHRPALVLFTSDHGQSLGEDDLFLHGHPQAKNERQVPMVVWATPEFERRFPHAMARLRSKQSVPTSHDTIFHSLLDCVGAKGSMIDPTLSLCH